MATVNLRRGDATFKITASRLDGEGRSLVALGGFCAVIRGDGKPQQGLIFDNGFVDLTDDPTAEASLQGVDPTLEAKLVSAVCQPRPRHGFCDPDNPIFHATVLAKVTVAFGGEVFADRIVLEGTLMDDCASPPPSISA